MMIDEKEQLALAGEGAKGVSLAELAGHVEKSAPRYTVYGMETDDGWAAVFIYTCPSGSKPRERMLYASSRRSAEALVTDEAGLTLAKRVEATDPEEITAELQEEFKPKAETKTGFSKPKRPGRK
jgi:twinfilin-like protein